ncbi:hypothetical protein Nepgr_023695 [Nepenthes gracilis]|uniref:Uncharacterized protein n=1 Tax=Nepenthes gracilis TaxID=150966 RepID=A0AAD3XXX8_NEPGR|nr:hypothetical protein Nepgr_023695 [Nepenthes gracilis]
MASTRTVLNLLLTESTQPFPLEHQKGTSSFSFANSTLTSFVHAIVSDFIASTVGIPSLEARHPLPRGRIYLRAANPKEAIQREGRTAFKSGCT